jgi:hypothetical protein
MPVSPGLIITDKPY